MSRRSAAGLFSVVLPRLRSFATEPPTKAFDPEPRNRPRRSFRDSPDERKGARRLPCLAMLLRSDERIVRSAFAVLARESRPRGFRGPGTLYLTSHRLVFEGPISRSFRGGVVPGERSARVVDRPLREIDNTTVRSESNGRAWLDVQFPDVHAVLDVLEPEAWARAILQAKRVFATPGALAPSLAGRPAVRIRCRVCGNPMNDPNAPCPTCGAVN